LRAGLSAPKSAVKSRSINAFGTFFAGKVLTVHQTGNGNKKMELKVLALMALMAAILAATRFTERSRKPAPARVRSNLDANA
jgi:hypothetical protein